MIDIENIRDTVVSSIKNYIGIPVIRQNQSAEPPDYPYIGYTVTTPMMTNNGTYGEFWENGVQYYRKEFRQIWSFTVCSDNDLQSKKFAFMLYDYLDKAGSIALSDNEIVVQRIENITNRDNLLTTDYEYRNGFDVTFAFMNEISDDDTNNEIISNIKFI